VTVAGIDFSTKAIDVVLLNDDTDHATWHRYTITHKQGAFYAARQVNDAMPTSSFWDQVWLAAIEDPYSNSRGTAKALGMIRGAVLASIPTRLPILPTAPQEWKRVFCGNPSASKTDVKDAAIRRGFDPADAAQDAYDAYGIAWAIRKLNHDAIERNAA
jgi:Holliday junction resolvasome RuvABC endonuclease subunit